MLCGSEEVVGLAFSDFEGYIRVPRAQVYATKQGETKRPHVTQVVRASEMVRALFRQHSLFTRNDQETMWGCPVSDDMWTFGRKIAAGFTLSFVCR